MPDTTLDVTLYLDGALWRRVTAGGFRADIQRVTQGSGHTGFSVPVPSELQDGREHRVQIYFADTGVPLRRSPLTISGARVIASED